MKGVTRVVGGIGLLVFLCMGMLGVDVEEVRGETVQQVVFNQVTGRDHDTATDSAELSFVQNPWRTNTYITIDETKENVVYVYARYTIWNDNNYTSNIPYPERHYITEGVIEAWFYLNNNQVKYYPPSTMSVKNTWNNPSHTAGDQTHLTPYWTFTVKPNDIIHVHFEVMLYAYAEMDPDGDGVYEEVYRMDQNSAAYDFYVYIQAES